MSAILQLEDLSYSYQSHGNKIKILDQANFSFERGKFYSIIGPSGSGKTTTLALASGLDTTKEGRVLYEEKDIKKIGLDAYRNKHVAIIFQSFNLITYMTALQNVVTAMEITKVKEKNKKQKALEWFKKVGLTEAEARRKVLQLSGGQQQRVAIARALSCNVDLIFADEPTGNLDEETAKEIIALFKELAHKENKCVIAVTHSHELAKQSDVIIRMKNGKLVAEEECKPL